MKSKRKKLEDKAWKLFSIFIRKRDADWRGYVNCVTCGAKHMWNRGIDAGHFIHGITKATYFDERNVHAQCVRCNHYLSGNMRYYERYMQERYGNEVVMELEKLKDKQAYRGIKELEEIIEKYK